MYITKTRGYIYIYITETRGLKSKENTLHTFNLKNSAYALDAIISYTTGITYYGLGWEFTISGQIIPPPL